MKFLHLSDLHYHPSNDGRTSRKIREELIHYLSEQNICVDELIITGDFRHALFQTESNEETVITVKQYIMKIAESIGIMNPVENHIHIIPGNHDRIRPESKDSIKTINAIKNKYRVEAGNFNAKEIDYINKQFDFFDLLCNSLYGSNHYWKQVWQQSKLHTYRVLESKVVLLCLNTSIMHNSNADRNHLIIGNDNLELLLQEITEKYSTYPIIVLAHHSPEYFNDVERRAVEQIFRDYGNIQLYLCGDAHRVWWRRVNNYLEITMGCIKDAYGVETAFLVGDTDLSSYIAHHWVNGWEPYSGFNRSLDEDLHNNHKVLNIISNPRALAERLYQTIVGFGRFKGYNETEEKSITNIKDTIRSNSEEKTLEEIVFSLNSMMKFTNQEYSVCLYGKGGSGKTHQFINLIHEILYGLDEKENLKYPNVLPYYLELNDITELSENVVLQALARSMNIGQDKLEQILERANTNAIIFADGMNEVTDSTLRRAIANAICNIRAKYHTRIVLSSRDDHSGLFNSLGRGLNQIFVKAEICELSEGQINDYFSKVGVAVRYRDVPKATRRLLMTAQGLSMYTEMILDEPKKALDFSTLGALLQSYCDRIMTIDRNDVEVDLTFENLLSYIAYHMVLLEKFQLKIDELERLIKFEQIQELRSNKKTSLIFTDHGKEDYEFSHQNFRDYFAGLHLAKHLKKVNEKNIAEISNEFLVNNNVTGNDEILSLCADFLRLENIQNVINCLRLVSYNNYSFPLSVIIRLYAFANHNDISSMNLDLLDLRSVSLSNYKLYSKQGDEERCISFRGAKISEDTFLQNGLQTASSTICSYIYKDEQYICAFSASNAQLYNINNNIWRCVRNLPNNGWVNCCTVVEMHGQPCILLGCSKGRVSAFYPSDTKVDILFSIENESNGEIESIYCVQGADHQKKIICSDTNGNVFMCNQYGSSNPTPKLIHSFSTKKRQTIKDIFSKVGISPTSRLTVSKDFVYFCYGCEVLRCSLPLENNPKFEMFKKFNGVSLVIKDIIFADGLLFLNMGKKVSLIPCNRSNVDVDVIPYELDSKKKLHHFTKFSPTKQKQTVLIGVYAIQNDYSELQNFYRITVKYDKFKDEYLLAGEEIYGQQTLATYTAVCFNQPNSTILRIATVSDDRSVQILSPDDEESDTILHKGSYDGIHSIDTISDNELLIAQYDGAVSHWIRSRSGSWLCCDVFHIHDNWVWKVQHYYNNKCLHFISCSYDGTLKDVNTETGVEKILIDTGKIQTRIPILDYTIIFDDSENICGIVALTEKKLLWLHNNKMPTITEHVLQLQENWKNYAFRSIALFNNDKPYVSVKVTTKSGAEQCCVAAVSDNEIKMEFMTENTCGFIRCLKIYDFNQNKIMIIGGNLNNTQYFAFYVYDGCTWQYKGSSNPSLSTDFPTKFESISDTETIVSSMMESDSFDSVNDFIAEPLVSEKDEEIRFSLSVSHKVGKVVHYEIKIEPSLTTIRKQFVIDDISSQPMCITAVDNQLLIGKLNGEAMFLEKQTHERFNIRTYANLTASVSVKLGDADFGSKYLKEEFQKHFEGYFDFDD